MSLSFKSQLAPKNLEFKPSEMVISDKHCCILTIISYPKMIGPGFLASVTNLPGIKVVVKHIPINF